SRNVAMTLETLPAWSAFPGVGSFANVELDALVARRRMCRSFLELPLGPGMLERALSLAGHAPSAGNTQGWSFVVLEGTETMKFWEHEADSAWLAHPSHPGLLNAPAIVLPLASRDAYLARYAEPDKVAVGAGRPGQWRVPYWLVDTAFATMLLLLGLAQEGLGALFFALRKPPGPLLTQLGVPEGWEALGAVAVGWPSPDDQPTSSAGRPRRPASETVHWGRW
ncbi:MAG TPA: nitroreductase family protein, partial [Acidimicrobiales bacterium]|nr:nitroreductase family protein [Acidimicrobiales bacterium]